MTCPECKGSGTLRFAFPKPEGPMAVACQLCSATGEISDERMIWREEGQRRRSIRLEARENMRTFALRTGIPIIAVSDAERGIQNPWVVFAMEMREEDHG